MELVIAISVVVCLALALPLLLRKVAMSGGRLPPTTEWIEELSTERYRPMIRLLDGTDLEFLRSQPGFTPQMAVKLRAQRCRIFLGYLNCLEADFHRVCGAIKVLMLQSRHDRPDLAAVLVRQQAMFALGMAKVRVHLVLYRWGCGAVDVTRLVQLFEKMRIELRSIVGFPAPSES